MLSCYIADDSPSSIRLIHKYINQTDGLAFAGSTESGQEALQVLQRSDNNIDIVFLDIDIADLSGLEILDKVSKSYAVILVSGHHKFAQEAFVKGASGYLYKPLVYDRFYSAIQKVKMDFQTQEVSTGPSPHIYVPGEGREVRIRINLSEITYVLSAKNFCSIFLDDKSFVLCSLSLKRLEELLPSPMFLRVNRSSIVNTEKIVKYDAFDVVLKGEIEIAFGKDRRSEFLRALKSIRSNV